MGDFLTAVLVTVTAALLERLAVLLVRSLWSPAVPA
jgi:hypothetical protein